MSDNPDRGGQDRDGRMTTDQLRGEIDSGQAGDKIPFSDPAAAPLGTDDEAAGTPPSQEQIARARAAEVHMRSDDGGRAENNRTIPDRQGPMLSGAAVAGIIIALALIVAVVFIL